MLTLLINSLALLFYLMASVYQFMLIKQKYQRRQEYLLIIIALALAFHALGVYLLMALDEGIDFGINKMISLILAVVNCLVLLSSLRKPLHNLFVFLLPLSIIAIVIALLQQQPHFIAIGTGVKIHILLSLVAYSLLTIATLQVLLLGWQNHQLKSHHLAGAVKLLPPLQTMEQLMYELLWAGVILLTFGILVGFVYIENLFAQHLVHKTVLSLLAWSVFIGLLLGKHSFGWRGNTAVKWVLTGFCFLLLAYFGSKLVLEIIL